MNSNSDLRVTPVPPLELIDRTGKAADFPPDILAENPWLSDPIETYKRLGVAIQDQILSALPAQWSLAGKRVLDFGCGSGRVLRQFIDYADGIELWGCEMEERSVRWLQQNLSPPLCIVRSAEAPPLDLPSGHFDLIYAISVFTHLTDHWSSWLVELHRLLKPNGLFLATFHGPGVAHALARLGWHEPWDENQIGMHTIGVGTPWNQGGPSVMHSQWWLLAHWARAFEPISITPGTHGGQGIFLGRARSQGPTKEQLESSEPSEPREMAALRYSLRQAHAETGVLRAAAPSQTTAVSGTSTSRFPQVMRTFRRHLSNQKRE
jgi:SAM-dependent methyltransferase